MLVCIHILVLNDHTVKAYREDCRTVKNTVRIELKSVLEIVNGKYLDSTDNHVYEKVMEHPEKRRLHIHKHRKMKRNYQLLIYKISLIVSCSSK